MAAIGTIPVLFSTGNHASRPAASAVGKGGLYSCTTHSLVYQTDGSSWSTWASLTGTGLADPMTTRGDIIVRDASNVTNRLAVGSARRIVKSDGTDISWGLAPHIGAKAYNSGTQTMNGSGTNSGNTILTFDSEEYDTDTIHDTSSNTSRLTIPTGMTGRWRFGFFAFGTPAAAGTLIDVLLNGATPTFHGGRVYSGVASVSTTWVGSFEANLTAADYLELQLNNPSASTFTIGHGSAAVVQTAFWAHLIGVA